MKRNNDFKKKKKNGAKSDVKGLALIESLCVFNTGLNSLMKSIQKTKLSNFDLHFLKIANCLSFKAD